MKFGSDPSRTVTQQQKQGQSLGFGVEVHTSRVSIRETSVSCHKTRGQIFNVFLLRDVMKVMVARGYFDPLNTADNPDLPAIRL